MATKKKSQLTKYCRIFQWVEAKDSEFAGAIRDLCLEGALSPGGRVPGVTFLYPQDKEFRQDIIEKTYSDAADEAVKLVESLIIPLPLLAGGDFGRQAIGSRLGVKYAVEAADSARVKLAGGVELVPARDFHPLTHRAKSVAVWEIVKGRPSLTGETFKAPPGGRGPKTGGARARGGGDSANRRALAGTVEAEYARCLQADGCRTHNPYLGAVVSLLNFLKARNPDALLMLLPILDFDPLVTFYLIVEPYKTRGEFLLGDDLLFGEGAWNGASAYGDAVAEYKAFFAALPTQQGETATAPQSGEPAVPFLFRDRGGVAAQIDNLRTRITGASSGRSVPQPVEDAYASFISTNSVGGLGPIFPDSTIRALQGSKKLWQDELRFTIHAAVQTVLATRDLNPAAAVAEFARIVDDLRLKWPGDDYGAELCLGTAASLKADVAPRFGLIPLVKFVGSTDFLYLPVSPDTVGGGRGSMNPADWEVYNRNAAALGGLRRIQGMPRPGGVSPAALRELELYVHTHGALPPAVLSLAGTTTGGC